MPGGNAFRKFKKAVGPCVGSWLAGWLLQFLVGVTAWKVLPIDQHGVPAGWWDTPALAVAEACNSTAEWQEQRAVRAAESIPERATQL